MLTKEELNCLTEFAEKDNEFAEKFNAAVKAKNADEAIRLAAEKGFTLTAEDFAFDVLAYNRAQLREIRVHSTYSQGYLGLSRKSG